MEVFPLPRHLGQVTNFSVVITILLCLHTSRCEGICQRGVWELVFGLYQSPGMQNNNTPFYEVLLFGDPGGDRTRDHQLKRLLLYQLSYQVMCGVIFDVMNTTMFFVKSQGMCIKGEADQGWSAIADCPQYSRHCGSSASSFFSLITPSFLRRSNQSRPRIGRRK